MHELYYHDINNFTITTCTINKFLFMKKMAPYLYTCTCTHGHRYTIQFTGV